ncbi:hypothetical protein Patl1_05643 [Pistacia atlantica]|uniref:Uncharacterized protein n=1 Tax=Pistacia atlantica TaxID=434234 RepID=A0ACC1BRJ2_9ROSI|nr:hypothetical protein Patl1_05643 [Pistacia atlantica]
MAFRATGYWRSMFNRSSENRPCTISTTPKMKLFAQTTDSAGSKPTLQQV